MGQITYANKVALNENPEIAAINKVSDNDMNEIKQVVNDNYNNTIQITDTEPTDSDNKIWIDTGEIGSAVSEITNEYSTSAGLGYSANYINNLHTYSTTEHRVGTWIDGKPLYSKYVKIPNPSGIDGSGLQTQNFPHGISNLKRCVDFINPVFEGTGTYENRYFNFPVISNGGHITGIYEVDSTNVVIRSYNEGWSTSWYLEGVLVYTKTTD